MCDKTILENCTTLKSAPDCYKNQELCNRAIDNYHHALDFVPDCYMTQEMCDKVVYTHSSKTGKMCDKAFDKWFLVFSFLFF